MLLNLSLFNCIYPLGSFRIYIYALIIWELINIKIRQKLVISEIYPKFNVIIFLSINSTFYCLFTSLAFDNKPFEFLFYEYKYYFVSFNHSFEVINK